MRFAPVNPLLPVAPRVTFMTTNPELPDGFDIWSNGITFRGDEGSTVQTFPWCDDVTTEKLNMTGLGSSFPQFKPFRVTATARCQDVLEAEDPVFVQTVLDQLDASMSVILTKQLDSASYQTSNPSLQVNGVTATVATGSIDLVVGSLIDQWCQTFQTGGFTLHAPALLLPFMMDSYLVELVDGQYIGPYGRPVSVLPGYDATVNTGKVTMYISGQVEWSMRDKRVQPDSYVGRSTPLRTDLWSVFVDTDAILRFDPTKVLTSDVAVS